MRTALVITVLNEEKDITKLLESISDQTKMPDEVVIVDGLSADKTIPILKRYTGKIRNRLKVLIKKGNRSTGRNEGVRNTNSEIIAFTDSGCTLDKRWFENIVRPFRNKNVEVVAGYYKGVTRTVFQKCLVPYTLVMPDRVDAEKFLPATRSMAIRKSVFAKLGGFNEELSHNEDYSFAKRMEKENVKIWFEKDAVVGWIPRKNFRQAFIMFFRFAYGDTDAKIIRPSVMFLFSRYFLGVYFLFLCILYKSAQGLVLLLLIFILYVAWSVAKNYRYVKDRRALLLLPCLQFAADTAVLSGTLIGCLKILRNFSFPLYFTANKYLFLVLGVYLLIGLVFLNWGIPNFDRPFPFHMDEWHQLQAVRSTIAYGTPNVAGAANGTMFHFLTSGLYLIPFTLVGIINPVKIAIDDYVLRQTIFEILRLNTLFFGVLSIFTIYNIAKTIKINEKLVITFFTFTPIWLTLSGYFKYDIALIFWILLSTLFLVQFYKNLNPGNFVIASIPIALAISVKVSAVPLLGIYVFSYVLFKNKVNFKHFVTGIVLILLCILLFGIPDMLFGKGSIFDYFYDNVIHTPKGSTNLILGDSPVLQLYIFQYPLLFGYGLFALFIPSLFYLSSKILNKNLFSNLKRYKLEVLIIMSLFFFLVSTLPLNIYVTGNRSLVFLPFIVLIIVSAIKLLPKSKLLQRVLPVALLIIISLQIFQSFSWLYIKFEQSPQTNASNWIQENIKSGEKIGIENIPIYQLLPDIIQKEFYFNQYGVGQGNKYSYEIINEKTILLPSVIIITNGEIENKILKKSPKKNLSAIINREGYKKVKVFEPNLRLYKMFASPTDFYLSGLITYPLTISIYTK